MQVGGNTLHSEILRCINCIWNKEELLQRWEESVWYIFMKRTIKLTVVIIEEYHCYQLQTKSFPYSYLK